MVNKFDRSVLYTPMGFSANYICEIEKDRGVSFKRTKMIMDLLGLKEAAIDDYAILHAVCKSVTQRAAKLLAATMAATLEKMKRDDQTIGIDGSFYRKHPKFMQTVEFYCNLLLNKSIQYKIAVVGGGSGIGAALAAAFANKEH
ncbi:hypothetical protein ACOME3_008000 [Neoechinorhynchus agilis]